MSWVSVFTSTLPLLAILFYVVPIVFVIWFLLRFIKLQQERNDILRSILKKLDQRNQ
ncbi:hypothetical protein [Heyndrickxia sporothermodurans]|uniref:hypothetical protein n=1 Tax=Heyndrickxia sporothermodurans TaxID=46224 RepID=UPI0035DF2BBC